MADTTLDDAIASSAFADRALPNHALANYCTYRVGGPARFFVVVETIEDLVELSLVTQRCDAATLAIGRGSNLLVSSAGFDGIAFSLGDAFADVEVAGNVVAAGASARLPLVARASVAHGLSGFAWAVGVPGSIGGAVRMNAGGHGSDMSASLIAATVVDLTSGEVETWDNATCGFSYRHSAIGPHHVVVEATLGLDTGSKEAGEAAMAEIVRWRRENQPGGQNAGSVFTNPDGDSAGRLIDAAGLKDFRIGTAAVSSKHANFIQADPNGSADDVYAVMMAVRQRVEDHVGVVLEPETRLVGFAS